MEADMEIGNVPGSLLKGSWRAAFPSMSWYVGAPQIKQIHHASSSPVLMHRSCGRHENAGVFNSVQFFGMSWVAPTTKLRPRAFSKFCFWWSGTACHLTAFEGVAVGVAFNMQSVWIGAATRAQQIAVLICAALPVKILAFHFQPQWRTDESIEPLLVEQSWMTPPALSIV